jgi:ankyrin repeat protein
LHYAVLNKNSKTYVQMLIEAGADITLQNKDGKTPMDLVKTKTLRTFIENLLKDKALA